MVSGAVLMCQKDNSSRIRVKLIPDPEVKKSPDPESRYATLLGGNINKKKLGHRGVKNGPFSETTPEHNLFFADKKSTGAYHS
jgi:hypothetical protein